MQKIQIMTSFHTNSSSNFTELEIFSAPCLEKMDFKKRKLAHNLFKHWRIAEITIERLQFEYEHFKCNIRLQINFAMKN